LRVAGLWRKIKLVQYAASLFLTGTKKEGKITNMGRNQHWGSKKIQGHVKYAKTRKPWKRAEEHKTRQAGTEDTHHRALEALEERSE
jgi:hypothetical protein